MFITVCAADTVRLTEPEVFEALLRAMRRVGKQRSVRVHAYCVMPDHLHAVISAMGDGGDMGGWLRFAKRETARGLELPGMWLRSYWDRHARAENDLTAMVEYALANPVRKGLCERWSEWERSWSEWHADSPGPDPNVIAEGR